MNGDLDESCPLCGEPALAGRASVALAHGRIHRCKSCGSGVLRPRPAERELVELHCSADYFDHPYFESRRSLTPALQASFERRAAFIEALCPLKGARVLEVGCDSGVFLEYLRQHAGVLPSGVDVSAPAVQLARARGLDARLGTLEEVGFAGESFDVVCAYDLVEHVAEPSRLLAEVRRILRPHGVLVLETPNYDGLIYRLGRLAGRLSVPAWLRAAQERLWPPFHVQYLTARSLERSLARARLAALRVQGRELAPSELALGGWLRLAVVLASGLAALLHQPTLLVGAATPAGAGPRVPGRRETP